MSALEFLKKAVGWWVRECPQQIVFLHIAKCGGSSIEKAFRQHAPFSWAYIASEASLHAARLLYQLADPSENDYYQVYTFREHLLLYFMSQNIRFISGHLCFSEAAYRHFGPTYKFVTMLRDPVKRWISHYFYDRYKATSTHQKLEQDLASFLRSPQGKNLGHYYVKLIGGLNVETDYTSSQAIQRAKENLSKFAVVGCLEHRNLFLRQIDQQWGLRLKLPHINQNPKSRAFIQQVLTPEFEQAIAEVCQPDRELYAHAIQTFVQGGQ